MWTETPGRAARHYARLVLRRSFEAASRVLTVSEASKRDLLDHFGGAPERVEVIPNSVSREFFVDRSGRELARVRARWDLPAEYVLYTGNVKPHKNLERLVREQATPGDMVVCLGAGTISAWANALPARLQA